MTKYAVFLRGVNVGGHNLLNMKETCKRLEKIGFNDVASYKQSGNIVIETKDERELAVQKIKMELFKVLNKDIGVFLRTYEEIEAIIEFEPFKKYDLEKDKVYVVLIPKGSMKDEKFPIRPSNYGVELISRNDSAIFAISCLYKGKFGSPNVFIESKYKLPATTRNWNTINGVAKMMGVK